jgi:hypothetical protein
LLLVVVSVHVALQQVPFVTPICEHDAPLLFPVGLQSGCPVLHDQVPVWQAFDGVHAPVCVHETHPPSKQTLPPLSVHIVPSIFFP